MKIFFSILMTLVFSSMASAQPLRPGGIETNGGNAYAAEFFSLLDSTIVAPESKILPEYESLVVNKIRAKRYQVTVLSQAQVFLNEHEVSAINQPQRNLIILSESSWVALSQEQKVLLIIHEMLPIAGHLDQNYSLSSSLLGLLNTYDSEADQIKDLISMCQKHRIENFGLLLRKRTDLSHFIHLAALRGCHDFIDKAVKSNWNIDACWDNVTAYQRLVKSVDVLRSAEMEDRLKTAEILRDLGANETASCKK